MGCVVKPTQMEANEMDRGSGLCLLVGLTSITYVLKTSACEHSPSISSRDVKQCQVNTLRILKSDLFLFSLEPYQL